MDINLHNFGMEQPLPLKLWKWIVDVYNKSFKCFCLFVCFSTSYKYLYLVDMLTMEPNA